MKEAGSAEQFRLFQQAIVLAGEAVETLKRDQRAAIDALRLDSRWREIPACDDNTGGESKSQNSHDSLLDLTFLIAATDPKASIY
jgi:hypothetical protein